MTTVLITGANRDIRQEFARQYLDAGWGVIATCRNPVAILNPINWVLSRYSPCTGAKSGAWKRAAV